MNNSKKWLNLLGALFSKLFSAFLCALIITGCGSDSSSENPSDSNAGVNDERNNPPIINGLPSNVAIKSNQTSVLTVNANDIDGDSLSFSLSGSDAAHLSVSSNGVIEFLQAPMAGEQAEYQVTVTVSDGQLSVSQSLLITIFADIDDNVGDVTLGNCTSTCDFPGTIILGKPTDTSMSINIVSNEDSQLLIEYGDSAEALTNNSGVQQSEIKTLTAQTPLEITLNNLTANKVYYYRINHLLTDNVSNNDESSNTFVRYTTSSFTTQKARGETFNFAIHADPHVGIRLRGPQEEEKADDDQYEKTLANTLAFSPDFMIDLGDTFMAEKNAQRDFYAPDDGVDKTPAIFEWVQFDYQYLRSFFGQITHSVPLFLVNGNHEGEMGWEKNEQESIAVWATNLRKSYFPAPTDNEFYSGTTTEESFVGRHDGFYAWQWGDAQFIVLDPFWYAETKPKVDTEWEWTLGQEQYDWLTATLESSDAKFKFVFMHNLVGGQNDSNGLGRGGVLVASDWEWGGMNPNTGENEFAQNRPGWAKPIHQLLVAHSVNIVFHGHDHVYVKEQHSDGIIYQAVPQPSTLNDNDTKATKRADEAGYDIINGVVGFGSGFLNITVTESNATVDYIRTLENSVTKSDCQSLPNIGCYEVAHSYQITAPPIN